MSGNSAQRKKARAARDAQRNAVAWSLEVSQRAERIHDLETELAAEKERRMAEERAAAAHGSEAAVLRRILADVRRDLAGGRALVENTQGQRDRADQRADALRAALDEALRDLADANRLLAKLREQDHDAAKLRRRLHERGGEVEALRGQLSRMRHLLRAVADGNMRASAAADVAAEIAAQPTPSLPPISSLPGLAPSEQFAEAVRRQGEIG